MYFEVNCKQKVIFIQYSQRVLYVRKILINKKYDTIRTFPKSKLKMVETRDNIDAPNTLYMIANFPGLVQAW
jgi:hypothetical protein